MVDCGWDMKQVCPPKQRTNLSTTAIRVSTLTSYFLGLPSFPTRRRLITPSCCWCSSFDHRSEAGIAFQVYARLIWSARHMLHWSTSRHGSRKLRNVLLIVRKEGVGKRWNGSTTEEGVWKPFWIEGGLDLFSELYYGFTYYLFPNYRPDSGHQPTALLSCQQVVGHRVSACQMVSAGMRSNCYHRWGKTLDSRTICALLAE